MADEIPTADQTGIARTSDGTIADQATEKSSATTTQETGTPSTTAEGKTLLTEEGKTEAKTETKEADKADTKAPETYTDYKLPEGFTLDPEVKTQADTLFKGMGLTQDQAQSLVDFYTKQTTEAFQAPFAAYKEMTDNWRKESESHPELKGKLGSGQEVNVRIGKALDSLNDPKLSSDFRELMDLTGAGNHQAFIRVIDKLASRVTEGTHVSGNGPSKDGQSAPNQAPPSAAAAMYPNLPSARR